MRKVERGQKLENIVLAVSGMSFWCLLMPANLYGMMGIPIFTVLLFLWAQRTPGWLKRAKEHFKVIFLVPAVLLYYVLLTNFYARWMPSGMVKRVAVFFGFSNRQLILLGQIVLGCLSLLFSIGAGGLLAGQMVSAREKEDDIQKVSLKDFAFCAVAALCFSFLLALQPWTDQYPGTDSTVFLYIGERMREGLVPYTDLFDHKGILLYFLEYLGMALTPGSFTGVWLVEVGNLFAAAVLIFRITGLFCCRRPVQYLTVTLVLATFDGYLAYEGGNLVEEYALPWILLALFLFLRYFMKGTYRFGDIVFLGISFAAVFFLRANMVTVWAAFLPVVFFTMAWKKQWKDIGRCIVGFLLGCAAVFVPVIGYAVKTGCLKEMYHCYIQFNFGYSDSEGGILANFWSAWFLAKISFVFFAAHVLAFCKFMKNRMYRLNLWFTAVSLLLASMSGRSYYHYGIILMPALVVPLVLLLNCFPKKAFSHSERLLWMIVSGALVLKAGSSILSFKEAEPSFAASYMQEHTKESDNVLVIGNVCRYYLESGRTTSNRFFYQTPPINISEELYEAFCEELRENMPDMVLINGTREDLFGESDYLAEACMLFEEWVNEENYFVEEQENFFTYQIQKQ